MNLVSALAVLLAAAAATARPQAPAGITTTTITIVASTATSIPGDVGPAPQGPAPLPGPGPVTRDYPIYTSAAGNCSCGYTYCGFILTQLYGFTSQDLQGAACVAGECPAAANFAPEHGLFLCRGGSPYQETSPQIQLLCACKTQCYNLEPDFRGHCSSPGMSVS